MGVLPTQILSDGNVYNKYGMDDMFLFFSVNPPGLQWSLFHLGTRFSQPVPMLFQTADNVFTTGGSQDNMDFLLGISAPLAIGETEIHPGLRWVYSTRQTPDGEDPWYDAISPGSMLLFPFNIKRAVGRRLSLVADIVPFYRFDSELIDVFADGSEYEERIDDGYAGIYLGLEISFDNNPSLRIEASTSEYVNSLSLLLSFGIGKL